MKKLISRKVILKTPIFQVSDNWLLDPEGHKIRRILVEHGGSTVVMPVDSEGRICLVRQYRYPVRAYLWELPAGMVDTGETPLQAAKRELAEETGLRASKWRKLIEFFPSPGFQQEKMTVFLAQELKPGPARPTDDEHLVVKWFTPDWIRRQIERGKICDAKTIIGMYAYEHLRK
ncbi:MAG: NUDIX hydrolase [Bryobacteraceae bacterium]|nr:NUDIX hydrolase [Bryobacteraceae bacterium]MDW8377258.1 NUDIX hydrolase [Bryobacterales bacterium]